MGTVELRSNIHKIVDTIQNEQLLRTIYDFLKIHEKNHPGQQWTSLTEEQKQEVMLACEEAEDYDNLIARETIFKRKK
jgi:hypothetical protein